MLSNGSMLQSRYEILDQIGGGGMGTVYFAKDTRLQGRQCAVKEMSPAELAPRDREWSIEAFRQEARLLAQLHHPGLTAVTDFFGEYGNWYLVMDYVEGDTLEKRLAEAPGGCFPVQEAMRIANQICDVLSYLHTQPSPVVFRDLKPGNVMCTPTGEIKLIDFGIARFFKPGKSQDTTFMGTPGYAAPEQYGGMGQSDPRTDIYSLGVLLNRMVTGFDPTTATSPFPIPDPRSVMPSIPDQIASVLLRATQLRPEQRYGSIAEMCAGLGLRTHAASESAMRTGTQVMPGSDASGSPDAARRGQGPWVWLAAGMGGVLLLGLCVVAALQLWPDPPPPATPTRDTVPSATSTLPPAEALTESATPPIETEVDETVEPSPSAPPSPTIKVSQQDFGRSVTGRSLSVTTIGYDGGDHVVVVGSIQGDQLTTRDLVHDLIGHLTSNQDSVPSGVAYHLVPTINPDGNAMNSRYNANEVDLNRNWGSGDWDSSPAVPGYTGGKAGAGGTHPFSEPETRALRDYLQNLRQSSSQLRVIVIHSSVRREKGQVYLGGHDALSLAQTYASATGYDIEYSWAEYTTSGEAVTWCDEQGILALDVVIPASQRSFTQVSGNRTLLEISAQALLAIAP